MIKKFLQTICLSIAVIASGAAAGAPVGYIHDVKGAVTLRDAGQQPVEAKVGGTFEQGATFITSANGQVTLKFEDGEVAILGPNSQFIATTYVYNKNKVAEGNIVFNLLRGGLRFTSGVLAGTSPSKFAIRTPTATAGVRGSAGIVIVNQDGTGTMITTTNGILTIQQVVVDAAGNRTNVGGAQSVNVGQASTVVRSGPGATPADSIANSLNTFSAGGAGTAAGGQALLQGFAQLMTARGSVNSPPNTPIDVAATALAITTAVALAADPTNAGLQAAAAAASYGCLKCVIVGS